MIKFFVQPEAVSGAHIYIDDKGDLKHLIKVLRAKIGDEVVISDGEAWEYTTEIENLEPDCATLKIVDSQKFATEPETLVTLYQGVPKGSKMETVIQKCVEIGVHEIVPVFMERTIVVEKGNISKKVDRWQKISDEAVKQCKRGIIPCVTNPINFREMLEQLQSTDTCDLVLCPYENEDGRTIKAALSEFAKGCFAEGYFAKDGAADCDSVKGESGGDSLAKAESVKKSRGARVAIIIGPEGGFSDSEIEALKELSRPVEIVTLGRTILRTETAGPVALAMTMYELEL